MNAWLELIKSVGWQVALILGLIWWALGTVSGAIADHAAATMRDNERILEALTKICINTAVSARQDPADCARVRLLPR